MRRIALVALALLAFPAFGHPNGTYEIDSNEDATVTFAFVERCPTDVDGALRGGLRTLTFSDMAQEDPYLFTTGFFVEVHADVGEVYIETDDLCVPLDEGQEIPATRSTFAGFTLRRI